MAIDLGIDIGTKNVRIYSATENRLIASEPTVVVVNQNKEIVAVGDEAQEMSGKTPEGYSVIYPVKDGGITDFDMVVGLLKRLIDSTPHTVFSKIRAAVSVPSGIGEVERRAAQEAAISAGAKEAYLIDAPLSGAIGAGIDIDEPKGYVIVDSGAGITEVAVISLGGIVVSKTVRSAGEALDNDIIQFIKKKYNVEIAPSTAEKVKLKFASAMTGLSADIVEVKGRDMYSGALKGVVVSAGEINGCVRENISAIVEAVRCVLEETPPELASDLMETGIILTGGTGKLKGLGSLIKNTTGINVYFAEDSDCVVSKGAALALKERSASSGVLKRVAGRKNY